MSISTGAFGNLRREFWLTHWVESAPSLLIFLGIHNKGGKLLQEGGPLPGPRVGSYLTLRNELSKETHVLTKQETLVGRGTWVESSRGNPGEVLCHVANSLRFYGDVVSFWVVSTNHSDSWFFMVACTSLSQDGFQQEGFWEVGRTYGLASPLSFWPFSNSSSWW